MLIHTLLRKSKKNLSLGLTTSYLQYPLAELKAHQSASGVPATGVKLIVIIAGAEIRYWM